MSSCQGELPEKEFYVKATDRNGNILVDGNIATLRNGFFELWLPRNRRIELTILGLNRRVKGTIETFDNSKTCITTLQLS
ncbi:MAG: CueP family metal-binding protein [Planctomycetota bacterium]|jgi:hypothetical protein